MECFNKMDKTGKICLAGVMAALVFVVTWLVRIPVPLPTLTGAYINIGDCVIIISSYMLGGVFGACVAGIGSALADILAGASQYIIATLIIKALMAFVFALIARRGKFGMYVFAAVIAELIMVAGYGIYEYFMFGWAVAIASFPYNMVQFAGNLVVSLPLYKAVKYLCKLPFLMKV
ncbi:MAG: ECF transporter S component [Eubacteriales bacterium]